jgi:AraC-like DNA-binding protein
MWRRYSVCSLSTLYENRVAEPVRQGNGGSLREVSNWLSFVMFFTRINPPQELACFIECYWIIEDDGVLPKREKIIPDGFTELIFHYGDPYRIALGHDWQTQSQCLLAGQIDAHFFLENTGRSGIFGIKLRPTTLTQLFAMDMSGYTNGVVDLFAVREIPDVNALASTLTSSVTHEEKVTAANDYFLRYASRVGEAMSPAQRAVDMIIQRRGMITISELTSLVSVGERQLENLFRRNIGLSPKRYCRIIRFSYIFELIREHSSWSDLAYEAAFYDQSHFIRNFRDFTGENPADYAFDERNMANFFLRKQAFG